MYSASYDNVTTKHIFIDVLRVRSFPVYVRWPAKMAVSLNWNRLNFRCIGYWVLEGMPNMHTASFRRFTCSSLFRKFVAGVQFPSTSFERLYQRYFFRSNINMLSILLWLLIALCVILLGKSSRLLFACVTTACRGKRSRWRN